MKRISFYRVECEGSGELGGFFRERSLPCSAKEIKGKIREADYVLAAHFDFHARAGNVRAVGRVMQAGAVLDVEWRAENFYLYPTQQGCRFWLKPSFRFADSVAGRYMLEKKCTGLFFDFNANEQCTDGVNLKDVISSAPAEPFEDPGFVYVIQSPYGYKIGKSRRLHERTRLFAVKLPFPTEVVMTGWFSNHSEAERRFHSLFHSKRLEGEWFALDDQDLMILQKELALNNVA